jgi:hypothetical protein
MNQISLEPTALSTAGVSYVTFESVQTENLIGRAAPRDQIFPADRTRLCRQHKAIYEGRDQSRSARRRRTSTVATRATRTIDPRRLVF